MDDHVERTARPAQVARFLGVDPKTVGRYARAGRIPHSVTLSGHRRYNLVEVRLALALPEPDAPQTVTVSALAVELELIGDELDRLQLRVQAFARNAQDYFRSQSDA